MNMKHTRYCAEIRSILEDAYSSGKNFLVWQRDAIGNVTFQVKASINSINEEGEIKFHLSEEVRAHQGIDTYFAVEDSTIIFKTDQIVPDGSLLFKLIKPHCNRPVVL